MANLDAPRGFNPVKIKYGSAPEVQYRTVANSVVIYEHQPVCYNTTGQIVAYTTTLALAGNIAGVAGHYVAAAAVNRTIMIYSDPNQLYEIQADDASITNSLGALGMLFSIATPNTGHSSLFFSQAELDASTGTTVLGTAATNIRPIQIVDQSDEIGHEDYTANARYIVRFMPQVHAFGVPATGV